MLKGAKKSGQMRGFFAERQTRAGLTRAKGAPRTSEVYRSARVMGLLSDRMGGTMEDRRGGERITK